MTNTQTTKHTPGPWHYINEPIPLNSLGDTVDNFIIYHNDDRKLDYSNSDPSQEIFGGITCEADARLIAAAPDGHEANIAALQYLCDENPRADRRGEVIDLLRAAIAKAEGK